MERECLKDSAMQPSHGYDAGPRAPSGPPFGGRAEWPGSQNETALSRVNMQVTAKHRGQHVVVLLVPDPVSIWIWIRYRFDCG